MRGDTLKQPIPCLFQQARKNREKTQCFSIKLHFVGIAFHKAHCCIFDQNLAVDWPSSPHVAVSLCVAARVLQGDAQPPGAHGHQGSHHGLSDTGLAAQQQAGPDTGKHFPRVGLASLTRLLTTRCIIPPCADTGALWRWSFFFFFLLLLLIIFI